MANYLIGFCFLILSLMLYYCVGISITKKEECMPYNVVIGYLAYSVLIAVGGIGCQVVNLSWMLFAIYMALVIIGLVVFSVYQIRKYDLLDFGISISGFIRKYWLLGFILICLMLLMMLNYKAIWFGNHLDDGYYISKIASSPYMEYSFRTIPSTGLFRGDGFNSYDLNTYELEASVYVYFLNINAVIFTRFFLSAMNYILFIFSIYSFAYKIARKYDIEDFENKIQYACIIVLFFAFHEMFLRQNVITLQDSNQINTAMFYGSSLVRTCSVLMMILPFFDKDDLTLKDVICVAGISLVLISKSSIALPNIYIIAMGYLLTHLLLSFSKKKIFIGLLIALGLFGAGLLLPLGRVDYDHINYSYQMLRADFASVIGKVLIISFIASFFIKDPDIIKLNCFFLIMLGLFVLPGFNVIFSKLSVYSFVVGRTHTLLFYTLCIFLFTDFVILFKKYHINNFMNHAVLSFLTIALTFGSFYSLYYAGNYLFYDETIGNNKFDLLHALHIAKDNPYLIPSNTVRIGEVIEEIYEEKQEDIYVISRELVLEDGTAHAQATMIRAVAPHAYSISAIGRYGIGPNKNFEMYRQDDQYALEVFINAPDNTSYNDLKEVVDKYNINCIIVPYDQGQYSSYLEKSDFYIYDSVYNYKNSVGYSIFYRD